MIKHPLPVFVGVFLCLSLVIGVRGNTDEIVAKPGSTPTINGSIGATEWEDADYVSFNETTVYVQQDGENLYIGFNISDATLDPMFVDLASVFIDVNDDGNATLQPDDIGITVFRDETLSEANVTDGTWNFMNVSVSGWTAKVHDAGDVWQVEISISYSKIGVTAGVPKTIGAAFAAWNADVGGNPSTWPPTLVETNPATWGDITSNEYNWVPEFSSLLFLPLLIAVASFAALYATFVNKRRLK